LVDELVTVGGALRHRLIRAPGWSPIVIELVDSQQVISFEDRLKRDVVVKGSVACMDRIVLPGTSMMQSSMAVAWPVSVHADGSAHR
jgi:hypothetical protein